MYIDLHAVKSVMYIDLHAVRFNLQTESIIDGAMCIAPYARQVLSRIDLSHWVAQHKER
jgi:hypothetical protein